MTNSCPRFTRYLIHAPLRFPGWYRLSEYVATTIKKGAHVLVEGSLVSTTYERANGKGKKAKTNKQTFWCIRADVVRKLDRGEPEPETVASGSAASSDALTASDPPPF